jgi:hypothetical protein
VVDWLGAMERWEQNGREPEVLSGSGPPSAKAFMRPVCAFPHVARYRGAGTSDDAANWSCVDPAEHRLIDERIQGLVKSRQGFGPLQVQA